MSQYSFFRFQADKLPVFIILSLSLLDFILFFTIDNHWFIAAFWLMMIIPKGIISAWNHHHQHRHVFEQTWLNRILEFFYALHSGVTTNLWVLHHNMGHHRNFLDQIKDQSRWKRKDGSTMRELEYSLNVMLTAYYRGYQVGKNHPKQQKPFLIYTSLTLVILIALTIYNPFNALFLFILPMIGSLLYTTWATYDHHVGLDSQDQFKASYNNTSKWFNILTGNLGYHTAHHYKQGVHWSKLPDVHEKIKHKIPAECFKKSSFEIV